MGVAPLLLVGREERAEIAQPGGPEHGIDHGMGEDVGIGVPREPPVVRHLDPAQEQGAILPEPVGVIADAHPRAHPSASILRLRASKTAIRSTPQLRISLTARSYA